MISTSVNETSRQTLENPVNKTHIHEPMNETFLTVLEICKDNESRLEKIILYHYT